MEAPTPDLVPAFAMMIERAAPIAVGAIATGGARNHVPVAGGAFEGEGLAGRLVGGGETLLERADGVTMIEASYYIAFADGAVARCFGTGYRTGAATRLSLLFEAAEESSVASLATRAFIAEQQEGSATMTICRIV